MLFKNRVTEMLGVEVPVVQAPMGWIARAQLASAVSNAGGLGIITGLTQGTPANLAKEIERCRKMTSTIFSMRWWHGSREPPSINPIGSSGCCERTGSSPKKAIVIEACCPCFF